MPHISLGLHEATILAQYIQNTSVNSLQNLQVVEAHHFYSDIHLSVHGPNEETASQQDNPTTLCTRENCDHVRPCPSKRKKNHQLPIAHIVTSCRKFIIKPSEQ
jgi:hypothetical protein